MKLLVIDNYDSFVYNLVHMISNIGVETIAVVKNDRFLLSEVGQYDKILLSPGPGIPRESGLMTEVLQQFGPHKSILGVCLGHQAIGEAYGAKLKNLVEPLHGICSDISVLQEAPMFANTPSSFKIGHYHSWVIDDTTIGPDLKITARDGFGNIAAIAHRQFDIRGVQFHPESVLTENGKQIITNWIRQNP